MVDTDAAELYRLSHGFQAAEAYAVGHDRFNAVDFLVADSLKPGILRIGLGIVKMVCWHQGLPCTINIGFKTVFGNFLPVGQVFHGDNRIDFGWFIPGQFSDIAGCGIVQLSNGVGKPGL